MTYHKAWRVRRHPRDDAVLYVLAPTAGKAKSAVYHSEYSHYHEWYLEYTAHRVPELDYDDEARPGDPHDEPLTFFSVWRKKLMRLDCAICGSDIRNGPGTQWSNGWTAFCWKCRSDGPQSLRKQQSDYQPVDPNTPMIWVGDYE